MNQWLEIGANRRAVAYILFSAVMLGVLIAAGILPTRSQITETRQEAKELEARIEEQKIFHPLYKSLRQKIKNNQDPAEQKKDNPIMPERSLNIDNAAEILTSMAESAEMETSSFSPVPASMKEDSDRLLVHGRLQGDYGNLRQFLIGLVASPACESLEMLEAASTTHHPEYRLRLWLEIE
ncbi:MAG: hypothetical protein ACLFUN_02120 [Desulfobacterales bacterium]